MKSLLFILVFSLSAFAKGPTSREVLISSAMLDNSKMPFMERNQALSLNVEYDDVKHLRAEIGKTLNKTLKFFDKWDPKGEAHVTTVTPPEFNTQLTPWVNQADVDKIARDFDIQSSDIKVQGIGSGTKNFNGETGETFFVIVRSARLLKIREAIYQLYLKKGGPASGPKAFKPMHFFPHITIGYTHEDIHESDGLFKDKERSLDKRFDLKVLE